MDDLEPTLGIGEVSRCTGMSVRTIRFWADAGVVPATGRTPARHRRYDAAAVARLELVATLRGLGLGLEAIRAVLEGTATAAEVAAVHARALEAEIATLRLRRGVLVVVANRGSGHEEMKIVNDLARLSTLERQRLVDDFVAETFGDGQDPTGIGEPMRLATPALPDDPTPEQVQAWVEVAELMLDAGFRARVREMADAGQRRQRPRLPPRSREAVHGRGQRARRSSGGRWRGARVVRGRGRAPAPPPRGGPSPAAGGRRPARHLHRRPCRSVLAAGRGHQRLARLPLARTRLPVADPSPAGPPDSMSRP